MDKIKAFLDSNVLVTYFKGKARLNKLFSSEMLLKVQYVINPIVYQELLMASLQINKEINLDKLSELVEVFEIDASDIENRRSFYKNLRSFKNMAAHANDFLIITTAKDCDYLLTYDEAILQISKELKVKALPPEDFITQLEV